MTKNKSPTFPWVSGSVVVVMSVHPFTVPGMYSTRRVSNVITGRFRRQTMTGRGTEFTTRTYVQAMCVSSRRYLRIGSASVRFWPIVGYAKTAQKIYYDITRIYRTRIHAAVSMAEFVTHSLPGIEWKMCLQSVR